MIGIYTQLIVAIVNRKYDIPSLYHDTTACIRIINFCPKIMLTAIPFTNRIIEDGNYFLCSRVPCHKYA